MPAYQRWLPDSEAFGGTRDVQPYPVQQGTTYLDWGPAGERPGVVTEFAPPHRLGFHQTMALRNGPLTADIDVRILYRLLERDGATLVIRDLALTVQAQGWRRLFIPLIRYKFALENRRMMAALKVYAESQDGREPA
ncbi:hypothetical protein GJ697_28580 [Pseudoduganella sp. FT25W]|uniref:SRPBCC family protein n=1 Tax=Duganella alba TaxID=2666081 RepID=A0A6L5QSI5_9BURK|nr:hypothetical protein [Duganella alba]MRX11791.1 hypothetical protein [Duganella alba]MRX20286.1 hypothetical protein [Duganella alba]